jgi:NAD(P)-dependent dehydrogenase (short-subunit alcohol dehydrogenase family)
VTDKKTWFITGAGRGMGVDIAQAALAAGHAVVASGRNPERVSAALGEADDLLAFKLDVTDPADAQAAVQAAVERFGRIDVLVNNAGNFYAGFFEEITPGDFRAQVETTLFGPINVTRAVLPVMRAQRAGLVVAISSTAGIVGQEFCTAYAAAKFGVEGWIESLAPRSRRLGSARCWWSRAFPAPSCSARSRPTTPRLRSRIMPSGPPRLSLPGRP